LSDESNFVSLFRRRVAEAPDKRAMVFLHDAGPGVSEETVTYRELDRAVKRVASWLLANTSFGDRAILLFPPGTQFLTGFLACLYAGVIAVPAPLPNGSGRDLARLQGVALDSGARTILTESRFASTVYDWIDNQVLPARVSYAATDLLPEGSPYEWELPELTGETIAFLQYTSGSTSVPRGVVVKHANLMHNQRLIRHALGSTRDLMGVGWLPHYHDMGLIGMLLHPLSVGGTIIFMSPMTFLKRPYWWLWAVDKYRCTMSVAPNFAFDLANRRITDEQLAGLDLSSLTALCNGSEPIHHETLRTFADRFSGAGLDERAILPCYGLAESTLFVTGTKGRGMVSRTVDIAALERNELRDPATPADGKVLVSCGTPDGVTIQIVDPASHEVLPDGRVGEIWLRSSSVAAGYWNQPAATAQTFRAIPAEGTADFLRTGDLGVIEHGELYVVGRLKEMLIVNGRNLYPADIEHVAHSAHPVLQAGCAAAFAVGDRSERLVLVHEVGVHRLKDVSAEELIRLVQGKVRAELDVDLVQVVLVNNGAIAKTTSGKIQRRLMRDRFLSGQLNVLAMDGVPTTLNGAKVAP
jgi:acyl-CoA synthetase (AMP-forming)/AMP-acid ligase II